MFRLPIDYRTSSPIRQLLVGIWVTVLATIGSSQEPVQPLIPKSIEFIPLPDSTRQQQQATNRAPNSGQSLPQESIRDPGLKPAAFQSDLASPAQVPSNDDSLDGAPNEDPPPIPPNKYVEEELQDFSSWLDQVKVGYDGGFQIVSKSPVDLHASEDNFRLKLNGWGQLRNTDFESENRNRDLRQFQLKRARLVFSGSAFSPDFNYFIQFDGRSSDGDDIRLLDYYLSYDLGHHFLGMEPKQLGFRTGRWKMPFNLARYLSGREFEFSDRSVSSMFFDVNRSLAWGLYGKDTFRETEMNWEFGVFNGLVTGGAETGSAGTLDTNLAYSGRIYFDLFGNWGKGELADFDYHDALASRVGAGYAATTIDRSGSTEFRRVRVVDTGERLSDLLPMSVNEYSVYLYSIDCSHKFQGWSLTNEYYFRVVNAFDGTAIPALFDHGHWIQIGKFVIPDRLQLLVRWSRIEGNSGSLGNEDRSSREIAAGFAYYFRDQHAKLVFDATNVNGAPIDSAALDLAPGDDGWLFRTQIQFAF